ncbi:MAG: MATE family efflux transporter [Lutibacter sp.]
MGEYSKNYMKIYFWKAISIVSGFLTLLIVVPHLSNDKELYGIYSFCISFTLYLSYADIGFLSAGQKYASEAFAKGQRKDEVDMLGFTGAILLLMIAPFSIAMIYFSFYPEMVLSELSDAGRVIIGRIFLILGIVLPFQIILQRLVQSILIIRIKDYISLRIDVAFNLIKIASVFYFFSNGKYLIVEYFLFITLLTIVSSVLILILIRKSENYNFLDLFKAIKLSKKQFDITKKLAYSSLFLTIAWLIYYELDLIFIGKWFGPEEVAVYAIGFTFLNFLRTLWNSVFSPYAQRFNHLVVLDNKDELKKIITTIIDYTMPLCVIVTVILVVAAEPLTIFWVGDKYSDSVIIMKSLIVGSGFCFVTCPASYYFTAKTKYTFIYLISLTLPIVFIIGVFLLTPKLGTLGISIAKSFGMFIGFIISIIGLSDIYNPIKIIKKWFLNLLILSAIIILLLPFVLENVFSKLEKNSVDLMLLLFILGILTVASYLLILITKRNQRNDLKIIADLLVAKIKKNRA